MGLGREDRGTCGSYLRRIALSQTMESLISVLIGANLILLATEHSGQSRSRLRVSGWD